METTHHPTIDRYLPFLQQVLTPSRLRHTLGVAQVMNELADVYPFDRETALTAALLHDAAKDISAERQREVAEKAGMYFQCFGPYDYLHYQHGPLGAHFVRQALGITDPLILDAICMHTFNGFGANFNAPLVWCLRFADILEPNRNWSPFTWLHNGQARLRSLIFSGQLEQAALLHTAWIVRMFEQQSYLIHPNMRSIIQFLTARLKVDPSFFEG